MRPSWGVILSVAGAAIWVFGWPALQDRRALAEAIAQSCGVMVDRGFLPADDLKACTQADVIYRAGVASAFDRALPRMQDRLDKVQDRLDTMPGPLAGRHVTLAVFWQDYDPLAGISGSAGPDPDSIVMDVPWFMLTGYGGLRVEMPAGADPRMGQTGVEFNLSDDLMWLRDTPLMLLCRRYEHSEARCSGTLQATRSDTALWGWQVDALTIDPVGADHIKAVHDAQFLRSDGASVVSRRFIAQHFTRAYGPETEPAERD